MTQKANPSPSRPAGAFETAGAIAYGSNKGFVIDGNETTPIASQDDDINAGNLNTFVESSSNSSFTVSISPGEAFVFGAWLAIDTATTVTLEPSTQDQTVYLGWDRTSANEVIIGKDSDFSNASSDSDQRIPLYDFDTDNSGITFVTDRRTIGKSEELVSLALAENLNVPIYTELSEAPQEEGSIVALDGAGSDSIGVYYHDGNSYASTGNTDEEVENIIASVIKSGTDISVDYDDTAGTITVNNTGGYSDEETRQAIAAALVAGSNIGVTHNDASNEIVIETTALNREEVEDAVNSLITEGAGVTTSYDDASNALTISVDTGGISLTDLTDRNSSNLSDHPFGAEDIQDGAITDEKLDSYDKSTSSWSINDANINSISGDDAKYEQVFTKSRTANVVVWKDSTGVVYATGDTQELASGTDATNVLQTAVDSVGVGGKVFVKDPLELKNITINNKMELEFANGATVTPTGGYETIRIRASGVTLRNYHLQGSSTHGLVVFKDYGGSNRIENILLENILLEGDGGLGVELKNINNIKVNNMNIIGYPYGGLHVINVADLVSHSMWIIVNEGNWGARFAGCAAISMVHPLFDSQLGGGNGMQMYNNNEVQIIGGTTIANEGKGIVINDQNDEIILNGHVSRKNTSDGIKIDNPNGSRVTLDAVTSKENGEWGYNLTSCPNLYFDKSFAKSNGFGDIYSPGVADAIDNCPFYVSQNEGSASVADGEAIAHGLDDIPTYVNLTSTEQGHTVSVGSLSESSIQVDIVDSAGNVVGTPETVYWDASV